MEFVISLIVLVVFAVLMIRNALKTSRESCRAPTEPPWIALVGDSTIDHHVSHSHHVHHHDAVLDVGHHHERQTPRGSGWLASSPRNRGTR